MPLTDLVPAEFARRHLLTGRELVAARRRAQGGERLPTACAPFDQLLGGGLERGTLVELVGWGSSGRFSLALSALAAVTACGECAALVDLGDGLDPHSAAAAGVDLERLLWARPRRLDEALGSAEVILEAGLPLLVLELGVPPVPGGRGVEAFWLRLARAAQRHRTALLVSAPYRVAGTAAHAVVEARDRRGVWSGHGASPRLLAGVAARLGLVKGPGWQSAETQTLELHAAPPPPPPVVPVTKQVHDDKAAFLAKMAAKMATKTAATGAVPASAAGGRSPARDEAPPPDPLMVARRAIA